MSMPPQRGSTRRPRPSRMGEPPANMVWKRYEWYAKYFRTFLEAMTEAGNDAQDAGEVLASMYAIGVSLATQSIHPSSPQSNWHQKYKPYYRQWLKTQNVAKHIKALQEVDEEGSKHEIAFVNEFFGYTQQRVKKHVTKRVRDSRNEFDEGDTEYPVWALQTTKQACDAMQHELLSIAKEHLSRGDDAVVSLVDLEESYTNALIEIKETADYPPYVSTPYRFATYVEFYSSREVPESSEETDGDDYDTEMGEYSDVEEADEIDTTEIDESSAEDATSSRDVAVENIATPQAENPARYALPLPNMDSLSSPPNLEASRTSRDSSNATQAALPQDAIVVYTPIPATSRARLVPLEERRFLREFPEVTQPHASIDIRCSICWEDYSWGNVLHHDVVMSSSCVHSFHRVCLTRWVNRESKDNCPMCRAPMVSMAAAPVGDREFLPALGGRDATRDSDRLDGIIERLAAHARGRD